MYDDSNCYSTAEGPRICIQIESALQLQSHVFTCIQIARKLSQNAWKSFGLLGTIDSDRSVPCESIRIVLFGTNQIVLLLHWLFPIGYMLLFYKPILIAITSIADHTIAVLTIIELAFLH